MTNATLLDDLYRDILLDHYRNPRHRGHLATANRSADGANPLCGDQITIEARVDSDGRLEEIAFTGTGCSISQASSSMMAGYVQGHTTEEAYAAVARFQQMMLTGEPPVEEMGDIEALAGVAKFPVRVKCASLAWKTLEQALKDGAQAAAAPVTTDDGKE
jgi:nitrogen fixation protein NifU and related proteins